MRGLSVADVQTLHGVLVFPPCAGVIGYQWGKIFICNCIPPACGGYRNPGAGKGACLAYSPRMRGLSGTLGCLLHSVRVFPPHAGVIGHPHGYLLHSVSIPPACGGYRQKCQALTKPPSYSPRLRGLSDGLARLKCPFGVFPRMRGLSASALLVNR